MIHHKNPITDKVIVAGVVTMYEDKAPFKKAGKSILGALEYDADNDSIRCHVCGDWFSTLCNHIQIHGVTARKYKLKYGLLLRTALVGEQSRLRRIAAKVNAKESGISLGKTYGGRSRGRKWKKYKGRKVAASEYQNSRKLCPAQILDKIRSIAAVVGHTPTRTELREHGLSPGTVSLRFGNLTAAAKLAALEPRKSGAAGHVNNFRYTKQQLISYLRNHYEMFGRVPSQSDCSRGRLPSSNTFQCRFGSWNKALIAAGLPSRLVGGVWKKEK